MNILNILIRLAAAFGAIQVLVAVFIVVVYAIVERLMRLKR